MLGAGVNKDHVPSRGNDFPANRSRCANRGRRLQNARSRRFWLAEAPQVAIVPRTMSQHSSLKGQGAIKAKRNVLKRFERVEVLKKRGQFKDGQRVTGLPKTKPDE